MQLQHGVNNYVSNRSVSDCVDAFSEVSAVTYEAACSDHGPGSSAGRPLRPGRPLPTASVSLSQRTTQCQAEVHDALALHSCISKLRGRGTLNLSGLAECGLGPRPSVRSSGVRAPRTDPPQKSSVRGADGPSREKQKTYKTAILGQRMSGSRTQRPAA